MKNKYFSFVALAAAALATSCASDDLAEQKQDQNQNGTRTVTLTASVNEGQTRVGMKKESGAKASFYWQNNDAILVQTVKDGTYGGAEFTTSADNGATSANFTGDVDSDSEVGGYAVYPYSESQKHSFTGEKALTYVFPASYTYSKVESNIFSKTTDGTTAYPSNPTNMPMLGTISGKSISFKCLGGLAVIRIDKMPAESGTLTISANEKLSGSFTVSDLSADGAQIATTSTVTNDADKTVTFKFTGAKTGEVGVFYLPLATGSYSGVKITIDSQTETINYGNLSVARKSVTAIPLYANGEDGKLTKFSKIDGNVYTLNGHEFVDLGLSSGLLWATMNIGAEDAKAAGSYFAWGETTPKTSFTDTNYTAFTSASEFPSTLDAAHDAATANWGAGVRMPTAAEFEELLKGCKLGYDFTEEDKTLYGMTYAGSKDGYTDNYIYLPTAGMYLYGSYEGTTYDGATLMKDSGKGGSVKGDVSTYWSSNYEEANSSKVLSFLEERFYVSESTPYWGCSVRAVAEKP